MRRNLPSMGALQGFEAAARHLSFAEAARECCLTAGAISRQVRLLEGEIGATLLHRKAGGLVLSEAGRAYLAEIRDALARIDEATQRVSRRRREPARLSIATLPGFGARWLMPRYAGFAARRPEIAVTFYTRTEPVAFTREPLDAAIRFGRTPGADVQADWLMDAERLPVCHPDLRHDPALPIGAALATYRLLHHAGQPSTWAEWIEDVGADPPVLRHGPSFEQLHLMIEAALSGLGLALLPRFMIEQELASGRLVIPFTERPAGRWSYWLVYPGTKRLSPAMRTFRAWLLDEAVQERPPPAAAEAPYPG